MFFKFLLLFHLVFVANGQDLRLNGTGSADNKGRVEVLHNGEWGTVCDDKFSDNNNAANVICRMLGFNNGGIPVNSSVFGMGTGEIWMDEVTCTGKEPKIENCLFGGWGSGDCGHSEDVGVICRSNVTTQVSATTTPSPANIQPSNCSVTSSVVRLIGPKNSPGVGFVEIKYNNTWYSVCDDFWDLQDAKVICRMLCYDTNLTTTGLDKNLMYIKDNVSSSILLDDVGCDGTETNVLSCPNNFGDHNCQKGEYASVRCIPPIAPTISEPPEPKLQCDNERFTVSFSRSYDTSLEPKHLTIFNKYTGQCRLEKSMTDANVMMKIPFTDCGTNNTGNSSHLMYVITIFYNYTTQISGIVRKNTYVIELVCEFPRNKTNNGNFQPQSQFVTMAAPGQFHTVMLLFADYTYQVPLKPTALYLGDLVVTVVGLNATHSNLNLVTPTCISTPTAHRNDSKKHTLFENNCVVDDTVRINPINNTAMSFSFNAFKFVGSDNVYIHCMSVVCRLDEKNSMCDRSCNINTGRKRRSIAEGASTVLYTISPRLNFKRPSDSEEAQIQREWGTVTENYSTKTTLTTTKSTARSSSNRPFSATPRSTTPTLTTGLETTESTTTKPTARSSSNRPFSATPRSTTQTLTTGPTTTESTNTQQTTQQGNVKSTTTVPKWSASRTSKPISTTAPVKTMSTTNESRTPMLTTSKSFSEDATPISSSSKRAPTTTASTGKWKTLIVRASPSTTRANTVMDRDVTPTPSQQALNEKNVNEKRNPGIYHAGLQDFDLTNGSCRSFTYSFLPLLLLFSNILLKGISSL